MANSARERATPTGSSPRPMGGARRVGVAPRSPRAPERGVAWWGTTRGDDGAAGSGNVTTPNCLIPGHDARELIGNPAPSSPARSLARSVSLYWERPRCPLELIVPGAAGGGGTRGSKRGIINIRRAADSSARGALRIRFIMMAIQRLHFTLGPLFSWENLEEAQSRAFCCCRCRLLRILVHKRASVLIYRKLYIGVCYNIALGVYI